MPVSTTTLESTNGDTVVISDKEQDYLEDDIILDTDPQSMYDTGFKARTQSGAFEPGGRVVGDEIPIREPVLPFWLTVASKPRFQALWGTPRRFQKVKCTWDGPSGPRFLILRLAKEISYTTEDGFDGAIDDTYHAVVSALAVNPFYEGPEDVADWTNPDDRFTVVVTATGGTFPLTFAGETISPELPYNAAPSAVQSAIEALPAVGAGKVTVTGTAKNYLVVFAVGTNGVLTGSASNLTGTGHKIEIGYAPNTGYFDVWNHTDQPDWLE